LKLKSERLELKSGFNFVTVGRLDEGKNHQLLIRAMVELKVISILLEMEL